MFDRMKPQHVGVAAVIVLALGLIALTYSRGGSDAGDAVGESVVIPEPPVLDLPSVFSLTGFEERHEGQEICVTGDVSSQSYRNCTLRLSGFSNVIIEGCLFVDSRIHVVDCVNVSLTGNVFRDHYVWEDPAVLVQGVRGFCFTGNMVVNNSVGMAVCGGSDLDISFNVFEANDQHNAVMGLNSCGAAIHNNVFRCNFPHALMIVNREEDPGVQLDVYENLFQLNIEDAVNFEDYRGAAEPTTVRRNIVNGTGQAGINIEYNSWGANIVIEGNYIVDNGLLTGELLDEDGRPTSLYPSHPHQPEPYAEGWKHGVKLEDCSGVTLVNNTITGNMGSGVDCVNSRDVTLVGNIISGNGVGVSVRPYDVTSFTREFSPLEEGDAGVSILSVGGNVIAENERDWTVEEDCAVIELND
ncbi:right-handed parallel beta-helix repeat-containing protein [Candidatus Bathyarchaeota archaeon]|nr:right-handed parallel beta-helix repeat-containing protein [Candidatus Bathyarchaeota archaeon]